MAETFDVTPTLKGAVGEVLLKRHKGEVREFFREWCLQDLKDHNLEWIPESDFTVTFDIERSPHSYDVCIDGAYATWYPDTLYTLRFRPEINTISSFEPYTVEFPIEVKTGQSSELSDNQRAVMSVIEQQSKPIFPLRVRVVVQDFPDSFSVMPHRIRHHGNTPLPEYTTDDTINPPAETRSDESGSAELSDFAEGSPNEEEMSTSDYPTTSCDEPTTSWKESLQDEIVDAILAGTDDLESGFTVQTVAAEYDTEDPEEAIEEALNELQMLGHAYQSAADEWHII